MALLLLDDPETWPEDIRAAVQQLAKTAAGPCNYSDDIEVDADMSSAISILLNEHSMQVYHCTRLLPYEAAGIRTDGLQLLTTDLINNRIDDAYENEHLTAEHYASISQHHLFATAEHLNRGHRLGMLWFVPSRDPFRQGVHGVNPFLEKWGGEGIYRSEELMECPRLREMGTPSIVVAQIPVTWFASTMMLPLPDRMAAVVTGVPEVGFDLKITRALPGSKVVDIWTPGMSQYDKFPDLIRADQHS